MKTALLIFIALSTVSVARANDDHNDLQLETSTYIDCNGLVAEVENGEANVSGNLQGRVIHANKKTGTYVVQFHDLERNKTYNNVVCYQIVAN